MTDISLCHGCEYRDTETDHHWRCRSPQLQKLGASGIPCMFERDDTVEPGRSHQDGTGKCGPMVLNRKNREFV